MVSRELVNLCVRLVCAVLAASVPLPILLALDSWGIGVREIPLSKEGAMLMPFALRLLGSSLEVNH
jgi:hypothetical protein